MHFYSCLSSPSTITCINCRDFMCVSSFFTILLFVIWFFKNINYQISLVSPSFVLIFNVYHIITSALTHHISLIFPYCFHPRLLLLFYVYYYYSLIQFPFRKIPKKNLTSCIIKVQIEKIQFKFSTITWWNGKLLLFILAVFIQLLSIFLIHCSRYFWRNKKVWIMTILPYFNSIVGGEWHYLCV